MIPEMTGIIHVSTVIISVSQKNNLTSNSAVLRKYGAMLYSVTVSIGVWCRKWLLWLKLLHLTVLNEALIKTTSMNKTTFVYSNVSRIKGFWIPLVFWCVSKITLHWVFICLSDSAITERMGKLAQSFIAIVKN